MQEPTFASLEFAHKKRKARRQRFLERSDALALWAALEARVEPVYPPAEARTSTLPAGRDAAHPLRAALLQPERSVDGGRVLRGRVGARFCGLTLAGPIPDESTILHFRHLLERHQLGEALIETINAYLAGPGSSAAGGAPPATTSSGHVFLSFIHLAMISDQLQLL